MLRPFPRPGAALVPSSPAAPTVFRQESDPDWYTNWLQGIGGYFDLNLDKHYGAEGEVRLMRFNQLLDVHEDTFMGGPKFTYRIQEV